MSQFQAEMEEHLDVLQGLKRIEGRIMKAAAILSTTIRKGGKIMLCGNGGSAADCQHIAAEFVGRFVEDRPALAALALTVDSSALTCVANDYGYEHVFARQVEALGRPEDTLVAISTSGNSKSILNALDCAAAREMSTIALLGRDGGEARGRATCEIIVSSQATARIQEMHIFIAHFLCGEVERMVV